MEPKNPGLVDALEAAKAAHRGFTDYVAFGDSKTRTSTPKEGSVWTKLSPENPPPYGVPLAVRLTEPFKLDLPLLGVLYTQVIIGIFFEGVDPNDSVVVPVSVAHTTTGTIGSGIAIARVAAWSTLLHNY